MSGASHWLPIVCYYLPGKTSFWIWRIRSSHNWPALQPRLFRLSLGGHGSAGRTHRDHTGIGRRFSVPWCFHGAFVAGHDVFHLQGTIRGRHQRVRPTCLGQQMQFASSRQIRWNTRLMRVSETLEEWSYRPVVFGSSVVLLVYLFVLVSSCPFSDPSASE